MIEERDERYNSQKKGSTSVPFINTLVIFQRNKVEIF